MPQSLLEWFARNRTLVIILILLAAAFFALHSRQSDAASGEWAGLVAGGDPVVVEFFSNTWTTCLLAKPVVDGIERDVQPEAELVRVNALSRFGREGVQRFDVRAVPTLLVFDGCGRVVERQVGLINRARVVEAVHALDGCAAPDA